MVILKKLSVEEIVGTADTFDIVFCDMLTQILIDLPQGIHVDNKRHFGKLFYKICL